ncbi:FadR/GntR family transcriptional regulator [Microbacterium sp. NPDC077486]|uniref:FadR/GntR family transcriptional regulator n=1 Tax=Microbacterium sp. NPDC077486 TaxID=3154766 RepID=UPI003411FC6A
MTTVRRESLAEQAAELLLARIGAGEWQVGDKLPGETTLAPQLGVGRSTAREAIRILAGRGVLATRQGAGVFVTATEPAASWDAVLDRADIIAVLEARTAIEVEAAALAAERRTSADLDELTRTLAERDRRRTDVRAHVEADMAFHRAVVVASGNPVLRELFDGFAPRSLQAMIDMLRIRGHHGDAADQDAHGRIGDAIAARDPQTAGALTREHLDTVKRLFG